MCHSSRDRRSTERDGKRRCDESHRGACHYLRGLEGHRGLSDAGSPPGPSEGPLGHDHGSKLAPGGDPEPELSRLNRH